jgi:hypothetical protein
MNGWSYWGWEQQRRGRAGAGAIQKLDFPKHIRPTNYVRTLVMRAHFAPHDVECNYPVAAGSKRPGELSRTSGKNNRRPRTASWTGAQ